MLRLHDIPMGGDSWGGGLASLSCAVRKSWLSELAVAQTLETSENVLRRLCLKPTSFKCCR
jgi:hypothetical protein